MRIRTWKGDNNGRKEKENDKVEVEFDEEIEDGTKMKTQRILRSRKRRRMG